MDKDQDVFASTAVMCTMELGQNCNKYSKGTTEENKKKVLNRENVCSHI